MKKQILFLSSILLFSAKAFALSNCFIVMENNKVMQQEGDCKSRYSPASTFKIALSLMGYDARILQNATRPEWPYKKGYDAYLNAWKVPHNPKTWLRDSCVWYSQVLTSKLGMIKFKEYIEKFNYGNQDISGDQGKNNGLTHAWLSSSLQISPEEQVSFLQKFIHNQLPISKKSHEMTKKILFKEELSGGWQLYGKTGNGQQLDQNKNKTDLQHGWFIGWIEKNGRSISFANHVIDDKKYDSFASFRAACAAKNKLWQLIEQLEK